jgi:hypothetical protein
MRKRALFALAAGALLGCAGLNAGSLPTLTLNSPDLLGLPGAAVGWNFELHNLTDYYLVATSADYVTVTPVGTFEYWSPPPFVVVNPGDNWIETFDVSLQHGIGQYTIFGDAVGGALSIGFIQVTYDLYSKSPDDLAFNPLTDTFATGEFLQSDASVEVVPEPATLILTALALTITALARLRKRSAIV